MADLLVALTLVTALGCGLSAGALYAFSSFVMPALARSRNNALAAVEPTDPDAEALWRRYVTEWTRWNHVRTLAGIAAAAALTGALIAN